MSPDAVWDFEAEFEAILIASRREGAVKDSAIPGLHATDTVDIITEIDGEITATREEVKTPLNDGDTRVQRDTKHEWRNRPDLPLTITALMIGANR